MNEHKIAGGNANPVSIMAKDKKRSAETPITSQETVSRKRPRTDIAESIVANGTFTSAKSPPEITSVHRHLYQPDWKELLCQVIGADSDMDNEAILEVATAYQQILFSHKDSISEEETRSPSPQRHSAVYSILHRRRCARSRTSCIDIDAPFLAEEGHLASRDRHGNLDLHIAQKPGLGFIVFHEYRCCDWKDHQMHEGKDHQMHEQKDIIPYEQNIWLTSPLLVDALRVALKDVSIVPIQMKEKEDIRNPHIWMYHLRDTLPQRIAEQTEEQHKSHLELFVKVLCDEKKKEFEEVDQLLSTGKITPKYLEYLFVPGAIIVENRDPRGITFQTLCKIQQWPKVKYRWIMRSAEKADPEGTHESVTVTFETQTMNWAFDGNFFRAEKVQVFRFKYKADQLVEIQKLPYFPEHFLSKADRGLVKARGEMFWTCRERKFVSYFGQPLNSNEILSGTRFMVDLWQFRRTFPSAPVAQSNKASDLMESDLQKRNPPGDGFILLLPLTLVAFNFQDKTWRTLLVSRIAEVGWNQAAFDTVVLGEDLKSFIKALVMNVIEPANATDIIEGKGNGLVILLHGGPGTGKTLTAESVAEYAHKPLYRVTCGDIGTSPEDVEKHLKNALALGKMWDCGNRSCSEEGKTQLTTVAVVLLDEAEVFLQERSLIDINRNALVSVFLRVLEYYDGILILTSNRVGTFDEGFKSRIQFAIHYETLGSSSRKQIWTNFLHRLVTSQPDEIDIDDLDQRIEDLACYALNGRQIRNVLTTGRQLARYEKKPLTFERLKHVIDLSSRFDKYLEDVNDGLNDNQLARGDSIR
ncbi:MAG: hypothetical protein M1822_010218 [Bathelium mastoideum]|nr:MAG: hypothetical protein M1822_010218 [Bathelium mastoideum]